MVVVDMLDDIIAEERRLEDELRRLSLQPVKSTVAVISEESPRNDPPSESRNTIVSRTVSSLEGLRQINAVIRGLLPFEWPIKSVLAALMAVEVFTVQDLVHRQSIWFSDEALARCFGDMGLRRGSHVHVNGSCGMVFFNHVRYACTAANIGFKHIHYSISPNTEISSDDIDLAWGLMSFIPLLSELTTHQHDLVIISTDNFSSKYLEFARKKLDDILSTFRQSGITVLSNVPVVQLCATMQITPGA